MEDALPPTFTIEFGGHGIHPLLPSLFWLGYWSNGHPLHFCVAASHTEGKEQPHADILELWEPTVVKPKGQSVHAPIASGTPLYVPFGQGRHFGTPVCCKAGSVMA